MRGMTRSERDGPEIGRGSCPLTLALSPRGTFVKLENRMRGERDNRKTIDSLISDCGKYRKLDTVDQRSDTVSTKRLL